MHVDDGLGAFCQCSHNTMSIEVISSRGETRAMEITTDLSIEKLKLMALAAFNQDPVSSIKLAPQFKLVSINKKKSLLEEATVRDEDILEGDHILLLPIIAAKIEPDSVQKEMKGRGPSEAEISSSTSSLEPKNMDRKVLELGTSLDFQRELRKILVSLVDFAEKLLRNHPEVCPVLRDMKLGQETEPKKKAEETINGEALKQLMDMGFPSERAKRALKLNNMSPLEAMDWLLAYDSSSSSFPIPVPSSSSPSSSSTSSATSCATNIQAPVDTSGTFPKVPAIVECYRAFKRKHFKPNSKALNNLKQMGFDDNEVLDALWIHSNNEVAACEWLLTDRRPKSEDLQRGLRYESPIYKAVISNPTIQLGLVKPKIFFSFLQLIEEPNSTGKWLSDPETSPVLSQIFRIYHAEKHAGLDPVAEVTPRSTSAPHVTPSTSSGVSSLVNTTQGALPT